MEILKISETYARRAKVSSILTPWKGNICGTLANGQVGSEAERQGPWASCLYTVDLYMQVQ